MQNFPSKILQSRHKLYRFALRILGSVQEAEDVVQEVFLKVWERKAELLDIQNLEAWCMRMVKNRSLDTLKLKANQAHEEVYDKEITHSLGKQDQQLEVHDTLVHVGRIIDQLPTNQKMCIQLREIEGQSYEEISKILDIPMNQVKVNIFRARKKIRNELMKLDNVGMENY